MSTSESVISANPPSDGRDWDCQCARCGSSVERVDCETCGGDGYDGHDCGEDCCMCLGPEDNMPCDICEGDGGWLMCISGAEWCEAHPLPGREQVKSGALEWFVIGECA